MDEILQWAVLDWLVVGTVIVLGALVILVALSIRSWGGRMVEGLRDVAVGTDLVGSQLLDLNEQIREVCDPYNADSAKPRVLVKMVDFEDVLSDPIPGGGYRRRVLVEGQWIDITTNADL